MKKLATLFSSVYQPSQVQHPTSCYEVFMRSANFYINRSDLNIHHVVPQHHKIARVEPKPTRFKLVLVELNELDHMVYMSVNLK